MSGVLLTPGPVSTHLAVKGLSPAFNLGVSKSKFMAAAQQLEAVGLGQLVILEAISRSAHVFVKRPPDSIMGQLQDYALDEEYSQRYCLPPASTVTLKMQADLVRLGYVPESHFRVKRGAKYTGASKGQTMVPTGGHVVAPSMGHVMAPDGQSPVQYEDPDYEEKYDTGNPAE